MKIVFVTEDDFDRLWYKLRPQDQTQIGLACQHVYLTTRATLVIVRNTATVNVFEEDRSEKEFTLYGFFTWLASQS